jgi:hypothetical protein
MQKEKKVKCGASNRAAKPNQWQFVGGWWWRLVAFGGGLVVVW